MSKVIERGNWLVEFSQEWTEWFKPRAEFNWVNFTLIQIYYEDERCMGSRELLLRFLGLGLRVVHIYDRDAEMRAEVQARVAELFGEQTETPP